MKMYPDFRSANETLDGYYFGLVITMVIMALIALVFRFIP